MVGGGVRKTLERRELAGRISVIVPVYNGEETLSSCLESIQRQSYPNWEAILVDDGSLDQSGAICESFSQRDPRFHTFHIENSGAAAARNFGIQRAEGAYLGFLDSDDWLEPDALEILLELLEGSGAHCAACGYFIHLENGKKLRPAKELSNAPLCGEAALIALLQKHYYRGFLWNKLFSRKKMSEADCATTLLPELTICEDLYFLFYCLSKGIRIRYDPSPLCHHRNHSKSLTGQFFAGRFTELDAYQRMEELPNLSPKLRLLLRCRKGEAAVNLLPHALNAGEKSLAKKLRREGWAVLPDFCRCEAFTRYEKFRMVQLLCFPIVTKKLLSYLRGNRP